MDFGGEDSDDAENILRQALFEAEIGVFDHDHLDAEPGAEREDDGDDEQILVDLSKVPAAIERIAVSVTIHEADARRQNFGMVSNAYIRILNEETGREIARYDLSEDASVETAMIFGEIYRRDGEWKFRAVGQGFAGGLAALCHNFGVPIG